MGNNKQAIPYIHDDQNIKLYTVQDYLDDTGPKYLAMTMTKTMTLTMTI